MSHTLIDDGTLDTVLRCDDCGCESRFTFDASDYELEHGETEADAYQQFVEDCRKDAEDHDCLDAEPTEPEDGDITTHDHRTFYQYGHAVFTLEEMPNGHYWLTMIRNKSRIGTQEFPSVEAAVLAYMDRTTFWPNCWFISDHGNAHLMELTAR